MPQAWAASFAPAPPKPNMRTIDILADLISTRCRCGSPKKPRRSVCVDCWRILSEVEQRALYRKVGQGYEAAYEKAITVLGYHPEKKGAA